jgi:auxin response factor
MRSFNQPFSVGMRCRMRYESDDASERRLLAVDSNIYLC